MAKLWHLTDEPRWREAADGLIRAFSGAPEGIGGSPLLLMGADMLERGGCVVIDGPLDDPLAQALAMVARRAPDPSLTVLRLDRRIWPNGPPRGDLPRADSPVAMLCQGQTCSLPVATPEALAALLGGADRAGNPDLGIAPEPASRRIRRQASVFKALGAIFCNFHRK